MVFLAMRLLFDEFICLFKSHGVSVAPQGLKHPKATEKGKVNSRKRTNVCDHGIDCHPA